MRKKWVAGEVQNVKALQILIVGIMGYDSLVSDIFASIVLHKLKKYIEKFKSIIIICVDPTPNIYQ